MLAFKKIDFWISAISIFIFTVLALVMPMDVFIIGYFAVGGWQVISMLVHQLNNWFTNKGSNRYRYQFTTVAIIVATLASMVVPPLLFIFYILLFAAPIMAVYYARICFKELKVLEAKAFVHLK